MSNKKKCPICKLNISNKNHINTKHHLSYIKIMEWREEIMNKTDLITIDDCVRYSKQISNLMRLYDNQDNEEEYKNMQKIIVVVWEKFEEQNKKWHIPLKSINDKK